jgi:catechol 2,3-dioxygenase-like lactoylglutathione lyase family enzyme
VADHVVRITGLDHIVLTTQDVERALAWYRECLGLPGERVEEWRRGEAPFPSVRVDEGTIIDLLPGSATDSGRLDHFCLVVEPMDLQGLADSGRFDVVDGPARRFGARGDGTSLYIRDPDGTTIELRYYGSFASPMRATRT